MRKVIVFGNVPLATWVVKRILSCKHLYLVGVVCDEFSKDNFKHHDMEENSTYYYCNNKNINIITFNEAYKLALNESVLGISVRYHKIFKEYYFNAFSPGIINLHGGELPRYRGANIANYIVLEQSTRAGATLHFIANGIDEGDVVEREVFNLQSNETAHSVFKKTLHALQVAFNRFLSRINTSEYYEIKRVPQSDFIENGEIAKTYYKSGIEKHRYIDFYSSFTWEELDIKTRAFYFPGHRGAFLKKDQQMIELKYYSSNNEN